LSVLFHADAVVHVPFGAYPTACFQYYDYDPVYLKNYTRVAKDDDLYASYLEDMIFKNNAHSDLLDSVGRDRLEKIMADRNRGYAKKLDRR